LPPAEPLRARASGAAVLIRIADLIAIVLGLIGPAVLHDQRWTPAHRVAAIVAVGTYLLVAEFNGFYRQPARTSGAKEFWAIVSTWSVTLAGLMALAFITKTTAEFSRIVIAVWAVAVPLSIGTWRLLLRQILRSLRLRGIQTQTVAIAGATSVAHRLVAAIQADPTLGLVVRGVYDDRSRPRRNQDIEQIAPFIGSLDDLVRDAKEGRVDAVYIALPMRAEARAAELIRRLTDTTATVGFVPDFFVFDLLHAHWSSLGDVPVLNVFDTPFKGIEGWLKRAEDVILGLCALAVAAPLMIVIAIAVRLSSPGPVIFRQRRYGLSGREIHILKFRTMTVCEDGHHVQQAQVNDSRITPLGVFLRRTSLDELPQLLNVVGGSMSLVGPRPHAVAHNEIYRRRIQGYMLRHKVKPGITGWAQVNGWRGETDTIAKMEKRVEHDLHYIRNWSIWLDIAILFSTVFGKRTRDNAR
jgi:putative colanic acid biosynthesis UDP-glucose lipid carrier transferase